ncbi:alpha/beta hydrolase family protein [Parvularcula maris]|uniref:Alpha/beta hydrolase n=1 Tax=Parvularcula maris TaxID=2965077 RepID=A0A9X2RKG3_9PROT|nr:alpha/beta hydrolase [Parvularcula maris]MCQ8185748.1 alpha/beta hydrolase [Parvularcula maris]
MLRTLLVGMAAVLLTACGGDPEAPAGREDLTIADYQGDWSGTLEIAGTELPLVLHVDPDAEPAVTLDSPAQGAFGIPATEHAVEEGALSAAWGSIGARYLGRLSEDGLIEGEFAQGPMTLELVFSPYEEGDDEVTPPARSARPQEPQGELPYRVEEVALDVADGIQLGGSLTLPEGEGPFPAVVLLTGSGAQDRDETLLGHRPFLVLSDRLTRAGIATLRFDDRGIGASGGSLADADLSDLAADAAAMLGLLRAREDIGEVGLLGHSEGGIVAGMVPALNEASPDFIVSLAGPFAPMGDIVNYQVEEGLKASGANEAEIEEAMTLQRSLIAAASAEDTPEAGCDAALVIAEPRGVAEEARQLCSPLFHSYLKVDPAAGYDGYDGPVLALFGSKDTQVPVSMNLPLAEEALAGNEDAVIQVVDGANHLFQTAGTGRAEEYAEIEETMCEDVMETIAEFINLAASN